jgi:hypothetical protein
VCDRLLLRCFRKISFLCYYIHVYCLRCIWKKMHLFWISAWSWYLYYGSNWHSASFCEMCCYPRFGFILFLYIRNYKIFEMNHWTYLAVRMSWFVSLTGLCILSHQERIINLRWYFLMMNWVFLMKVIPESLCALNCISTFLLLSLSRHICWWTIRPRVYHPASNQCFGTNVVCYIYCYW